VSSRPRLDRVAGKAWPEDGGPPSLDVRDEVWGSDLHLWGPDVRALGLEDEMEDIELGERVSWWLCQAMLCASYGGPEQRKAGTTARMMVGQVASATSHRGLPFPQEWWPPSAGEFPERLRRGNGGHRA
jgi:hypothetical protein